MNDAAIAACIIDALEAAANRETGVKTLLVSVNLEMLAPAVAGAVEVKVARKTRTLLFLHADFRDAAGAGVASANSVHKVVGATATRAGGRVGA